MAKAKPKKKVKENSLAPKAKGLFDHINHLRGEQNPKYFDTLSDADKKSWSNYMICRFLSMQPELLEYVNEIQRYSSLPPAQFYQLLLLIVPTGRAYFPYIKSKNEKKWSKELMKLLRTHFEECERNVEEYLDLLHSNDLRIIVGKYGYAEKEIEELIGHEA